MPKNLPRKICLCRFFELGAGRRYFSPSLSLKNGPPLSCYQVGAVRRSWEKFSVPDGVLGGFNWCRQSAADPIPLFVQSVLPQRSSNSFFVPLQGKSAKRLKSFPPAMKIFWIFLNCPTGGWFIRVDKNRQMRVTATYKPVRIWRCERWNSPL